MSASPYVTLSSPPYVTVEGVVDQPSGGATVSGTGLVYADAGALEAVTVGSGLSLTGPAGSRTLSGSGGSPTLTDYWIPDPQHWEDTGADVDVAGTKYSIGGIWRVGNALYMFGARNGSGTDTNKILTATYDASGAVPTWSDTGATMPAALGGARIALIGSTLYAFGAYVNDTTIYSASLATPTVWSSTGSTIDARRDSAQMAIANGRIIIVGGYTGAAGLNTVGSASLASPTNWSTGGITLATPIWESGVATIGGAILSIGGASPFPTSYGMRGSVYSMQPDLRSSATGIFSGGLSFATLPQLFDNGRSIFAIGAGNSASALVCDVGSELQTSGWMVLANASPSALQYTCGWIGGDGRAYAVNYLTGRMFRSGRKKVYVPSSYVAASASAYAPLLGYTDEGLPAVVSSHVRMGVPPWLTDRTTAF